MTDITSVTSNIHSQQSSNIALQHNYSNISPVQQNGPASLTSSNMSGVSGAFTPPSFSSHPPPIPSSQPPLEGAIRSVPSRPSTPPSERQRRREKALAEEMRKSKLADIKDLIRLQGPLTEDAVVKTLQARFYNQKYQVQHSFYPIIYQYLAINQNPTCNSQSHWFNTRPADRALGQRPNRTNN